MTETELLAIFNFLEEASDLEKLPRTGLLLRGVKNGENVAAHVFETAILTMLIGDYLGEPVNMEKMLRMALIHELAEARITDIPYRTMKYLSYEDKSKMEKNAFKDICENMLNSEKYRDLFEEFETRSTIESKLVRAADKLQMMMKVYLCEKEGYGNLDVYWENEENFKDFDAPLAEQIYSFIKQKRYKMKGEK